MKVKVELYCVEDIRDIAFNCTVGNYYTIMYDTENPYFEHQINKHLVQRLNEGHFRLIAPWRYIPKHRELSSEVYSRIKGLTEYCENFYTKKTVESGVVSDASI